jgi:hypothetical protein
MNQKKIENKFYAAAPGKKEKFASKQLLSRLQDALREYGPKAKAYDSFSVGWAKAVLKEPELYEDTEVRQIIAEMKRAASQKFDRSGKKTEMAKRLVNTVQDAKSVRIAKVYKDPEYNEYVVKFYENGKYHANADFFTDNKEDANGTATMWIQNKFSRSGAKAKFAEAFPEEWDSSSDRDYLYVVNRLKSLLEVCSKKRADLVEVETKTIPLVMEMVRNAKKQKDVRLLESAMSRMNLLDRIRQSFSRPGKKAKFAWNDARGKTPEFQALMKWDRISGALRDMSEKFASANDKSYGQFMRAEDEAEARKIYAAAQDAARSYAKILAVLVSGI